MFLCCLINSVNGALSGNTGCLFAEQLAENDTLVGLVVDAKGKAVRNIPVSVRTKEGVVHTDKKGIFVLEDISQYDTLTLLFPKNKVYEVPVSGMSYMVITVQYNDFSAVEDKAKIIDIGYGKTPKSKSASGGDVVISGDELRATGENNILWAIAGRVAGVKIGQSNFGESTVSLRGSATSSFNAESVSPVFVLDGSIVSGIENVSVTDVLQVTIMKNASIYGSRGANGAIIVTTKK